MPFLNQTLVPTAVAPGAGPLTLRVSGAGFAPSATVAFNGTPLTTVFLDSDHLSALLPSAQTATGKTASVSVINPAPGGGSSNVVFFQVGAPQSSVGFTNAPASPLPVRSPVALTVVDLNGDGKPDLAVANLLSLAALLGNGDGTFRSSPGSPLALLSPPYDDFASPYAGALAVGDFTHTGYPGLVVAEPNNSAAEVFSGSVSGLLAPSSAAFVNTMYGPISQLLAADFNADGNLDLAVVNAIGYPSLVSLGYGKGSFSSTGNLFSQGMAEAGAVGDFDGDGKLDVAIAGGGTAAYPAAGIAISLGNGDGTFRQALGSPLSFGQFLSGVVAADFNGDGKLDLAVTDYATNTVLILLGKGDGTFQPPITFATGYEPEAIVAADFNNDGKLDLAIANYGGNTVTLLLGNGDGTFTQAAGSPFAVGKGPVAIAAADFNNDGKLDLAIANIMDGTVSILLQH